MNFIAPDAEELFRARLGQGWGVDPVRITKYMTSSQTLLVNLLGPVGSRRGWLKDVMGLVLRRADIVEVLDWKIEFAPPARNDYLGDMTRLDTFFRLRTANGVEGVVLELKYADRFSGRRVNLTENSRYAQLQSSGGLWRNARHAFLDHEIGQLLRCHALGTRILQVDERVLEPATLLLVSHPDDLIAPKVFERYRHHLVHATQAVHATLDTVLAAALRTAPTEAAIEVVRALQLRYLGHQMSEALWAEHLTAR